jgi:TctA family transporter
MSDASPLASLIALLTSPELIGVMLLAVPFGVLVGAIPGIGGKFGIAISIPFVFGMEPVAGAVFLVAMHAVVHTGGSLPGILLGIPGGGPDAAIVVDGYPMAQRGEAGRAIGASLTSSAVGGVVGGLLLAVLVPIVWPIVLAFGPAETFLLALLGITFIAAVSGGDLLKALIVGSAGLMLSFVGAEPQDGVARFTFGQLFLWDGIDLMAAVPAVFAIPEMIELGAATVKGPARSATTSGLGFRQMRHGLADVVRHRWLTFRASCLGALIGLVPGLGGEVASWVCYGHAAQTSRQPERFGQGAVEGVIAPDAANNSKEGGALLPTLFFGVPGSSGMALLLAAFVTLGLEPGPQLALGHADLIWTLIWALVLANVAGSIMLAACGRWLGLVAFTAGSRLVPFVLVLVIAGCLLASVHVQSLIVMIVLGALGTAMKRHGWPRPPFAIGLVLGSITERSFHQAWAIWGGAFLLKPGAIILFLLIAASVTFYVFRPVSLSSSR